MGLSAPSLTSVFVKVDDKLTPRYRMAVDRMLNGGYY